MTPLALLLALPLRADPADDALAAEMARAAQGLRLVGAPAPYLVAFDFLDTSDVRIEAVLGGIAWDERTPSRVLGAGVRVGEPVLDSANFASGYWGNDGYDDRDLGIAGSPAALRHGAWLLADRCYKQAVENLARKTAWRRTRPDPDRPPDFAPGAPSSGEEPPVPPPDGDALARLARSLSAVFLSHPQVETSRVHVAAQLGRRLLLDSTGTRVSKAHAETDLRVIACGRADDGAFLCDHATRVVRTPADLPSEDVLRAEAEALAGRVETWRAAPAAEAEYVGPVILTGDAALWLFRLLLVPSLTGTAPEERADTREGFDRPAAEPFRVRRRVLPPGFRVWDDPRADPSLPSSFAWDDEGVPARRVNLVEDGIVQALYGSRTPGRDVPASNGHGRAMPGSLARGMPSHVVVEPVDRASWRALVHRARRLAAGYGSQTVMVVRRIADPTVQEQRTWSFSGGQEESPVVALEIVRLFPDGHEEPVRGLRFEGLDAADLRDVVAAGASSTATFLLPADTSPFAFHGPTSGLPVTLTAPDVLLSEAVLVPDRGRGHVPLPLPSPLAR